MAEKTSGASRKETPRQKPSAQTSRTVTPIQKEGAQHSAAAAQLAPTIEEEIRYRAYELYEARGRQDGFHMEDWKVAEAEVLLRYRREKSA